MPSGQSEGARRSAHGSEHSVSFEAVGHSVGGGSASFTERAVVRSNSTRRHDDIPWSNSSTESVLGSVVRPQEVYTAAVADLQDAELSKSGKIKVHRATRSPRSISIRRSGAEYNAPGGLQPLTGPVSVLASGSYTAGAVRYPVDARISITPSTTATAEASGSPVHKSILDMPSRRAMSAPDSQHRISQSWTQHDAIRSNPVVAVNRNLQFGIALGGDSSDAGYSSASDCPDSPGSSFTAASSGANSPIKGTMSMSKLGSGSITNASVIAPRPPSGLSILKAAQAAQGIDDTAQPGGGARLPDPGRWPEADQGSPPPAEAASESGRQVVAYLSWLEEALTTGEMSSPTEGAPHRLRRRSYSQVSRVTSPVPSGSPRVASVIGHASGLDDLTQRMNSLPTTRMEVRQSLLRPGSGRNRAVQALVDAVRSKDEQQLIDTMEELRLADGTVHGLNELHPVTGKTPLHEAVLMNAVGMLKVLLAAGANPNVGHATAGPPLLHAAAWGEMDAVEQLLGQGASIAAVDAAGYTALHYAVAGGHLETTRLLIRNGADVRCRTQDGDTIMDLARGDVMRALFDGQTQSRSPSSGSGSCKISSPLMSPHDIPLSRAVSLEATITAKLLSPVVRSPQDSPLSRAASSQLSTSGRPTPPATEGARRMSRHSRRNSDHVPDVGALDAVTTSPLSDDSPASALGSPVILHLPSRLQRQASRGTRAAELQDILHAFEEDEEKIVHRVTERRYSFGFVPETTPPPGPYDAAGSSSAVANPTAAPSTEPSNGIETGADMMRRSMIQHVPSSAKIRFGIDIEKDPPMRDTERAPHTAVNVSIDSTTSELAQEVSDEGPPLEQAHSPGTSPRAAAPGAGDEAPLSPKRMRRISQAAEALASKSLGSSQAVLNLRAAQMFSQSVDQTTGDTHWTKGELLGEGAYGKVYAGLNQQTGELMAVKVLELVGRKGTPEQQQQLKELQLELDLYKKLQHKHIVGYLGAHFDVRSFSMYIFLEYVPGGSIASMLERFGSFSEELVRNYTRQLLLGLEYLHGCKVVHRDLKGGNVLVSRDGIVKLTDFGASKAYRDATITDGMKSLRGSVFWMAPEVIKGVGYGRKADIWSLGCTVVEMMTGRHPWPTLDNHWSAMFTIAKEREGPPRPERMSEKGLDFLNQCLQHDPKDRPTASEMLHHPWVSDIEVARKEAKAAKDLNHSL